MIVIRARNKGELRGTRVIVTHGYDIVPDCVRFIGRRGAGVLVGLMGMNSESLFLFVRSFRVAGMKTVEFSHFLSMSPIPLRFNRGDTMFICCVFRR